MLIHILLFLTPIFANMQSALEVSNCTEQELIAMSYENPQEPVKLENVAKACIGALNLNDIKVEIAIVEGTTHRLKYTWNGGKGHLHHFFNLPNSPCNPTERRPVENFTVNIDNVLSQLGNGLSENSCYEGDKGKNLTGGFGFKKKPNGKCERLCGNGQILVGTRSPFIFSSADGAVRMLSSGTGRATDVPMLDKRCQACPPNDSPNLASYTETKPNSNSCYDVNGCPENYEFFPNAAPDKMAKFSKVANAEMGKNCVARCSLHQKRNAEGVCENNSEKQCEEFKKAQSRLNTLHSRFTAASRTSRLGNCDMNAMRSAMSEWSTKATGFMTSAIANNCRNTEKALAFIQQHPSLYDYVVSNSSINMSCLGEQGGANSRLDPVIYALFQESIYFSVMANGVIH